TLTAEKGGISVSKNIMVTGGTTIVNPVIPGYIENYSTPTPLPTKTPTPTGRPSAAPDSSLEPDIGGILIDVLRVLLIGVVGVQLVVGVVIIALQVGQRH
ncbi:MAG TPA: hypothetical protein VMC61_07195, partial [Methanocella sp.]|nr:hypothetical protein [Methanocella sp.]